MSRGARCARSRCRPSRSTRLASRRTAFDSEFRVRRVTGLAPGGDSRRQRRLLADADADGDPPVGELEAHAGALVDRVVTGDIRSLPHKPWEPHLLVTVLLVGLADEDDVSARPEAGPSEDRERNRSGRGLVLHVGGPAAPDEPVGVEMARERRMRPVRRLGRNDVGVPEEAEGGPLAGAGDPGDEIRAVGVTCQQLVLDARRLEVATDLHRCRRLVPRGVRRVDADERAKKRSRFLAQRGVVHQASTRSARRRASPGAPAGRARRRTRRPAASARGRPLRPEDARPDRASAQRRTAARL